MRVFPVLLLLFAARPLLAQSYILSDLGLPAGYTGSSAKAVNGRGQVTGEISHGTGFSHAFLYSDGRMTDLGTLPGFSDSVGNAINDGGVIAGVSTKPDPADRSAHPSLVVHAFMVKTDTGTLRDLRPLGGALYLSSGINAAGQIVGAVITLRDQSRAFLYQGSRVAVLDDGAADSGWTLQEADGINDGGDIVGSGTIYGVRHAFLYRGGTVTDLNRFLPVGSGWALQEATGINDRGDIVCIGRRGEASHGFLLAGGVLTDLGELGGCPNIIEAHLNNSGQVVGVAEAASGTQQCAFLYDHGRLTDLNRAIPAEAHWSLTGANGINDSGVIVGAGEHEGRSRAFLLTPKGK